MTQPSLLLTDAFGIAPYVSALRDLEQSIHYPLGQDRFLIDHGPTYHAFFSGLGSPRFLLAFQRNRLVGSIAGVMRKVRWGKHDVQALYLCDLKVAPDARGHKLSRRMIRTGLRMLVRDPQLRRTRLFYAAAMQGADGDVMRAAGGLHPFRLGRTGAQLHLYFVAPARLAALDPSNCPAPPQGTPLCFGETELVDELGLVSTAGRKDLRLLSGRQWPLVHLTAGPSAWMPTFGAYLQRCGAALASSSDEETCFAVDERRTEHVQWLRSNGMEPGAVCTVYWLHIALRAQRPDYVHLPTSEI